MCKRLFCLVSFVLLVSQTCNAVEVARWDFEETSGTTATDGIASYVATLQGSASLNIAGKFGSGVDFTGDGGAVAAAAGLDALRFTGDFSIVLWINPDLAFGDYVRLIDFSASDGGLQDGYRLMTGSAGNADNFRFMSRQSGSNTSDIHTRDIGVGTWSLLVLRHDLDGDVTLNVLQDGDTVDAAFVAANAESWPTAGSIVYAAGDLKFGQMNSGGRAFDGQMDGIAFYDEVLTDAQVAAIFNTPPGSGPIAAGPNPAHDATDVPRDDVILSWEASELAVSHDVYFGTSFEDVKAATTASVEYRGNQADTAFSLDRLDFGQTYYWRIDEVNAPPDNTVFTGDIWSFTVEPVAYPIEDVNATASSVNSAGEGSENTINGSGLDADDLHSPDSAAMWLSSASDPNAAWIQYEFDKVYKLHQMVVWNHNTSTEPVIGLGVKEATIEYSADGANWTSLGTTHEFARGTGLPGYAANTTVDLGGAAAKYVKITANSNWGGLVPQFGLSEVRFSSIPVFAREPRPDAGAMGVDVNGTLSWRAGREAVTHDVYVSTDEQAVIDGNVPVVTVTEAGYSPAPLDVASTYFWRIDEVNEAETPPRWQGDIWSLSTQEYLVVDDFEAYNDIESGQEGSNLVYLTWIDGYVEPPDVRINGSTIGYTEPFQPSMETSIVYDGSQSVPLYYDNSTVAYSEVTAYIANQPSWASTLSIGSDWTKHGVKALTLRFFGDPNNSVNDRMYIKLNGSKVMYDGDAENLTRIGWQMWYIDLASIGVNTSNVTELSIGFEPVGAVGGKGVILLDGIRLYSYDRQLITPTDPGATGLQAHYEFDGTASDSSGNGLQGTLMGSPTFVPGKVGQAISLRGANDYVAITGYKGILGANPFSLSAWVRTTLPEVQQIIYYGTQTNGQRCEFRIDGTGDIRMGTGGGQIDSFATVNDGGWHHVVVTISENATNSSSDVRVYIDGLDDTEESTDLDPLYGIVADWDVTIGYRPSQQDRFFNGQIDDVRIYDRVLSAEEAAGLAGRTQPFDKPF